MSKQSIDWNFYKGLFTHGLVPALALVGAFMLGLLPFMKLDCSSPELSQPECRVIAKERNQIDIRCTQPTEESQPPKINTSLRRALFDKE
jgi:hypothetical protein|nr:MAG TPA: hypothetical protein [Herelleviridae sp.]